MIKTYKVELNQKDIDLLLFNKNCGIKKYLYNMFIFVNKERYENGEKFLNYMSFEKWLNNVYFKKHPEMLWIKEGSQKNRKDGLRLADIAFQRFFKKISSFPRFKRRRDKVSFYFVNDKQIKLERHRIKIPIFGWLRLKEYNYINKLDVKDIKSGNLIKEANKFYVCLAVECKEEIKPLDKPQTEGIGIDLGLNNLAVVSNGMVFSNVNKVDKGIKKLERRKDRLQKELNRRLKKQKTKKERLEIDRKDQKYKKLYKQNKLESQNFNLNKNLNTKEEANKKVISKNTIKTISKLQIVESKLSRIRKGFVIYVVNSLVKLNPQFITMEKLNIKGLLRNKHLSKSIKECNWGYFIDYMKHQCEKRGIRFSQVSTFYPSSKLCSCCDYKNVNLKLSDRIFNCPSCGLSIDRDLNASLNLSTVG